LKKEPKFELRVIIDKHIKRRTDVGPLYTFSLWYVETEKDTMRTTHTDEPEKKRVKRIYSEKKSLIGNGEAYSEKLVSNFKPFFDAGVEWFNVTDRPDPLGRQWYRGFDPDAKTHSEQFLKGVRGETLIRAKLKEAIEQYELKMSKM